MHHHSLSQPPLASAPLNTCSMIAGIVGLLLIMIPGFGMIGPALAILLSLAGRGNQMEFAGRGLTGIILGIIGIIGNIFFIAFYITILFIVNSAGY